MFPGGKILESQLWCPPFEALSKRQFTRKKIKAASFSFIFVLSNKNYNFYSKYMWKCPSSIWCWNSNPRPSEHESPPITTRPGLPPLNVLVFKLGCALFNKPIKLRLGNCQNSNWKKYGLPALIKVIRFQRSLLGLSRLRLDDLPRDWDISLQSPIIIVLNISYLFKSC